MRTKITEFKSEIQDWMERSIQEFKKPDPHKETKLKLEKLRSKRKERLKTHYGL
jgi:hypothetical protein